MQTVLNEAIKQKISSDNTQKDNSVFSYEVWRDQAA